ncbi:hypothetical protein CspeluHIS016_0202440 [Cutaneotrichosporon spelunceum]|uniref:Uncharacterized protein n=1 Tax=Cutaneotrichosporon spelunceum TaxID=1672016 RepID=A0AAD3TR44_9TREE|nr:hypothetical protein CspeluHIS016_0202440 [Cutaneotrichosporon spelunceum]
MSERPSQSEAAPQRPSPPRERQPSPLRSGSPRPRSQPSQSPKPSSTQSRSTPSHSRTASACCTSHSRDPPAQARPDPTHDVLTAGDGLAHSLGVSPPKTKAYLAEARARHRSSPSYDLSGGSAEGKHGPADGLTGFDPAVGYQESGSGGVFTASGGLTVVPTNAPALMYSGGQK